MPYKSEFKIVESYLHATTTGAFASVEEVVGCARQLRERCEMYGLRRVLHDERDLINSQDSLSIHEATESEEAEIFAQHGIRMAVICHPERLADTKLYETFLANRSVVYKAFLDENDAAKWLMD